MGVQTERGRPRRSECRPGGAGGDYPAATTTDFVYW
jgi:hypothetical protein